MSEIELSEFEFCDNLSLSFVTILVLVLSSFDLLIFFAVWVFDFCCYLSCYNLSFWVLSQFEFLSFVAIWFFKFRLNLSFWVVTIWVQFFQNLSFWVSSQFGFSHNLSFFHKGLGPTDWPTIRLLELLWVAKN